LFLSSVSLLFVFPGNRGRSPTFYGLFT